MMRLLKIVFLLFILIPSVSFSYITKNPNDPNIKAVCGDGSYSTSTGRGTCSYHGGVAYYL